MKNDKNDKFALRKQVRKEPSFGGSVEEKILYSIGIEKDEVDEDVVEEIYKKKSSSEPYRSMTFEKFKKAVKEKEPEFYEKIMYNTPHQRAYLYGSLYHREEEPRAHLESMYVKEAWRRKGYATQMMTEMMEDVDEHCYPTYGKVNTSKKPDDFIWDIDQGGYSLKMGDDYAIPLPTDKFNEQQEWLLDLYTEKFDFEVTNKKVDSEGKEYYWIKRPSQC